MTDEGQTAERPEREEPASGAPASGDAPIEALEGRVIAERYRVEKLLGEGGMGAVYRAEHIHMHKIVALKVLHAEMSNVPEVVARFEREAVAAGRIAHPNVAAATDFGRLEDGSFFLVLEYAAGQDLRGLLNATGALPPDRCVHIARQVAEALGAAHALTIVHRDLKPDNVMLIDRDGDPDFVKVLDFGIAKVTLGDLSDQPALTRMGAVFGTPDYMSPEQALGQPVDHRSDLYALGILMFEMLTGCTPFDHEDPTMVLAQQITTPPPPLPEHVPPALSALVLSLLAKDVQQRPESATDVIQVLDACTFGGDPVPPSEVEARSVPASGFVATDLALSAPRASNASFPDTALSPQPPVAIVVRKPNPLVVLAHDVSQSLEKLAPVLRKPVLVGTNSVPVWYLVASGAGLLLMALVFLLIVSIAVAASGGGSPVPVASSGVIPALSWNPMVPASSPAVSPRDVDRIESTPVYKRNIDDWVALAHGYSSMKRYRDSATAYRSVLQLERSRRHDPQLLYDLRVAAMDPSAYSLVVNLAEGRAGLGETGLDLLWDIWNDQRAKNDPQAEATFKKLVILSRRSSKSLRVAIELNATDRCSTIDGILNRAEKVADRRSQARLEFIHAKTGCSAEGCFPCLEGSEKLARALERARKRPAPSIERGYR